MTSAETFAHVVAIIDKNGLPIGNAQLAEQYEEDILELVISAGAEHGVTEEMRFVIFEEGEELFDPVTMQSLGKFEIVKGQAKVVHLQERMSKLRSSNTKRVLRNPLGISTINLKVSNSQSEYKVVAVPFRGVKIGDRVRPV